MVKTRLKAALIACVSVLPSVAIVLDKIFVTEELICEEKTVSTGVFALTHTRQNQQTHRKSLRFIIHHQPIAHKHTQKILLRIENQRNESFLI